MKTIVRALGPLIALAPAGSTLLAETEPESHPDKAIPISAELAKTCHALAIKALPTERAGREAYAQAQRDYFQDCIAKGGNMPDEPHTTGDSR